MRRFFEWQWLYPRAAFVAVVVMGASYLLGLGARSAAIRTGEQFFGSAVEVSHARVPLTSGCVELSGLRVADPHGSAVPRLEADCCQLELALKPLMNNQVVIERGRVYGLRFGDSSHDKAPWQKAAAASTMFGDNADEQASAWLTKLDERFERDALNELETIKRTEALNARWETQIASLKKRAAAIKQQANGLLQSASAAEANRLRHSATMGDLPTQIAAIREQIEQLNGEFEKLPSEVEVGRREIVSARRQDEQLLRERMKLAAIDQEALTAYLLREQVAMSVEQLVGWLQCGREFADRQSNVVVRSLEFQCTEQCLGQTVELCGLLTGYSSQPKLLREPMRLRMKSKGAMPLQVRASFDSAHSTPRDELIVDCREFRLPESTLGRSDELQLKLSPSIGSLVVSLRRDGDQLSGDVQLVQKQVLITPTMGSELSDVPLAKPFQMAMADVNSFATHITLGGTLDAPTCTLWSNLGPAVAEAMNGALRRSGEEHAAQVLAESRRLVDERLAALEREVAEQQEAFAKDTASLPQRLDTLARQQTRRERLSVERVGGRLPHNSLFQR